MLDSNRFLRPFVVAKRLFYASCSCRRDQNGRCYMCAEPPNTPDCLLTVSVDPMTVGQRIREVIEAKDLKDIWVADGAGSQKRHSATSLTASLRTRAALYSRRSRTFSKNQSTHFLAAPVTLFEHEQQTLRICSEHHHYPSPRVTQQGTSCYAGSPRQRKRRTNRMVIAPKVAATPDLSIFTDVRELRRNQIPRDLREQGVRRVFTVEGDSMTGAGIQPGDLLYVRTDISGSEANGRIVVCRYEDYECVKRMRSAGRRRRDAGQ